MKNYKFCPFCKSNLYKKKHGDRTRFSCRECGWVHYGNPLPSAVAFVHNENNEILLIKRGVAPGKSKWALPSGFIEQDELPEHAVIRELKEETNIRGSVHSFIGVYTEPTTLYGNVLLIAYDVKIIGGRVKPGSDTKSVKFYPINRLPKIPFGSHRTIIKDGIAKNQKRYRYIEVLKSKITEATVTHTQLFYNASMGIDGKIMRAANLVPGEKVHVLNYNNGERLITYTIEEKPGSRRFVLYGPASHKGKIGNKLCILSYTIFNVDEAKNFKPHVVILDERNRIKRKHT
jgi:8-oxo-dGTP diphosphatase